jgi:endonuclease III
MNIESTFKILEKTHQPTMLEELGDYTPFQMLVMTMLSARTKDSTTIPIVKAMFQKYPHPQDFVILNQSAIEKMIYGVGFFRVKAANLINLSKMIIEKYHGQVPETLEELTALPGVGRKTANCILAYTFKKPAIAVDIHVHRIANRLGWIKTKTPEETEQALMTLIPKNLWIKVNMLLVGHGQTVCKPVKPQCDICPIKTSCAFGQS